MRIPAPREGGAWPDRRHAPAGYRCPFCRIVAGEDLAPPHSRQTDVVCRDARATAFISTRWWPQNAGHVLVVPNEHHENVYEIPDDLLGPVHVLGKRIAGAIRATYGCDGTSFRQHNEPGGDQEVWHYHLHVFPRYAGDRLYERTREHRDALPDEREPYAARLREYLARSG